MPSARRVHLHIHGRVQGVFFRDTARQRAESLGLTGWVRNAEDGSVEMVVEGPEDAVEQFVGWAHRGPSRARVERVDVENEEPEGSPGRFRIVH